MYYYDCRYRLKLDDDLQVSWLIEGDVITIELAGNIGRLSCVLTVISGDE